MTHYFYLYRAAGSASEEALDRLPTSATCMNLLKLPPYRRFVQFLYLIIIRSASFVSSSGNIYLGLMTYVYGLCLSFLGKY